MIQKALSLLKKVFLSNVDTFTQMDLAEWKRIEGVDQYNKKRH